ncbi:hypothetical protein Taro_011824 [Colocasia esculenta]|uniref:Fucosyltransferase n=1 Tax=Colocasia esculenta TaxID=4460 RepID=A0A843UB65_COLES|nr:hypothetical protein [Colocasia esculenta]
MVPSKTLGYMAPMLSLAVLLFLSRFLEFPSISSPLPTAGLPDPRAAAAATTIPATPRRKEPFTDLVGAFDRWDKVVGCERFREKHRGWAPNASALQEAGTGDCRGLEVPHVSVLVKGWTWIPDNLDQMYSCRCGLSCLWTKSEVLGDKPDALLFENVRPPLQDSNSASCFHVIGTSKDGCMEVGSVGPDAASGNLRQKGGPLRVYMDLEASRKPSGFEDIFIGYHAKDDVQTTYAGALFHNSRNYHVSRQKRSDALVYWSSSRCLPDRDQLAKSFLSLVPHHSFGKCLNNVDGLDMALDFYPECSNGENSPPHWYDHLHCAMSHYKFVLAIENTVVESYVTEKLFYALDAGSVPIYFGAPNVWDFVPPNSIIDGSKFSSMEELAAYVKALAADPVAYAEYHAWRRCGVLGNYGKARATSLDTLPCRLCEYISRKGGKNLRTL